MDFWSRYLDQMARHRYNLISWWSMNPFPSIVKVPGFPSVHLADVQTASANKEEIIVVKKLTIDEKIQFWREVMQREGPRHRRVFLYLERLPVRRGGPGRPHPRQDVFDFQMASSRAMKLSVPGIESVTVPAGTFECFRVELVSVDDEGAMTAFMSVKEPRVMVRGDYVISASSAGGTARMELVGAK